MGCTNIQQTAAETTRGHVTLLFVDIDGVLNIGISDPGYGSALSCNSDNICRANKVSAATRARCTSWQRLLAASNRHADDGDSTYGDLCEGSAHLANIFVERLAALLAAAETQGRVICVLSSTWRVKNMKGVRQLEEGVSKHMGKQWCFDAMTDAEERGNPSGRLENIGNFLTQWVKTYEGTFDTARALVLEDFHITPLNGWALHGMNMTCEQDVEAYLYNSLPPLKDVAVRFVHTFDQWTTASGMDIHVGSGLTSKHFRGAMDFVNNAIEARCERIGHKETAKELPALSDTDTGSGTDLDDDSFHDEDSPFERGVSCGPQCPSSAQPILLISSQ